MNSEIKDEHRMWMWCLLAALAASQLYVVWELLAVLILFAAGVAPIALLAISVCLLQKGWAVTAAHFAHSHLPRVNIALGSRRSSRAVSV